MAFKVIFAVVIITCLSACESKFISSTDEEEWSTKLSGLKKPPFDQMQDDELKSSWQSQKAQQDQNTGYRRMSHDESSSESHEVEMRKKYKPWTRPGSEENPSYRSRPSYLRTSLDNDEPSTEYRQAYRTIQFQAPNMRRGGMQYQLRRSRPLSTEDDDVNKIVKDN